MRFLLAAVAAFFIFDVQAREQYAGQYDNVPPAVREWFKSQRQPGSGMPCCDISDGTYAEEDIRDGHYWVRFVYVHMRREFQQDWMIVPDNVIIREPNRYGAAVVWYQVSFDGQVSIRCYAPGAGI